MLIILVCGSQLSHGEKLNCRFINVHYNIGLLYSCYVTSLVNPHKNLTIEGYSGKHEANKNDADVKGIYIHDTNTKYIPTNLGSLFNLIALDMFRTQLVEINAKDFLGMQDLEEISFYNNNLTSVPLDAFATLTKLKIISLSSNQIEELPNGIFKNNLELEEILLWDNKIKILGTEIFQGLKKIKSVHLRWNICVNKEYKGATEINQLKNDIKMKCKNPSEVPATTTTTQNPMVEKIIKLEQELRESKEQQQTNDDALKKGLKHNTKTQNNYYYNID